VRAPRPNHLIDRTPPLGAAFVVVDEKLLEKSLKLSHEWTDTEWGFLTWRHHHH
jgi:hypothetical protein